MISGGACRSRGTLEAMLNPVSQAWPVALDGEGKIARQDMNVELVLAGHHQQPGYLEFADRALDHGVELARLLSGDLVES